jgi:hypothetical protein
MSGPFHDPGFIGAVKNLAHLGIGQVKVKHFPVELLDQAGDAYI